MKTWLKIVLAIAIIVLATGLFLQFDYNKIKLIGSIVQEENISEFNAKSDSIEINVQNNTMLNLSTSEKKLIIGGGYEFFRDSGAYQKCISWGNANCTNNKLYCPNGYEKIITGKYKSDPNSSSNVEQWFLCVDNSTVKINVTSKDSTQDSDTNSYQTFSLSKGAEDGISSLTITNN